MARTVNKRFRFVQDGSSHWYAIPAEKYAEFRKWVEYTDEYRGPRLPPWSVDFADYRLSHAIELYTFERVLRDR